VERKEERANCKTDRKFAKTTALLPALILPPLNIKLEYLDVCETISVKCKNENGN
jgi:hypothetical protein